MLKKQPMPFWPALFVGGVLVAAFAFVSARTRTDPRAEPKNAKSSQGMSDATAHRSVKDTLAQSSLQPRVEVEEITVTLRGFEPSEITRPAGRFLLVIANPSGNQDLDLSISHELGGRLQAFRLLQNQPSWNDSLLLPPGRYVLREPSHPNWSCRIIIR